MMSCLSKFFSLKLADHDARDMAIRSPLPTYNKAIFQPKSPSSIHGSHLVDHRGKPRGTEKVTPSGTPPSKKPRKSGMALQVQNGVTMPIKAAKNIAHVFVPF